jgi:putative hydrolase of the HAD superfamily
VPERLGRAVEQIFDNWIYHIPEMEGMRELILHIKQTYGAKVFVLSNISTYFAEHAHEIPILSLVDGCVFSAVCGMVKPNTDIFVHTCRTFALDPGQGIFIDDKPENVRAAQEVGMQGYVFDGDARALQIRLDHFLQEETL